MMNFLIEQVEWTHDSWSLPSLHFNISHTSSLIACGVTTGVPVLSWSFCYLRTVLFSNFSYVCVKDHRLLVKHVAFMLQIGIDVEEKQRKMRNNILSFARRYFSLSEVEFLQSFSDPEKQRREFIKLWTLKVSEFILLVLTLGNYVLSECFSLEAKFAKVCDVNRYI